MSDPAIVVQLNGGPHIDAHIEPDVQVVAKILAVGPQGPPGPPGERGPQGIPGIRGPKGDKGDNGDTGPQGPQGVRGETGAQGPKGDKGDTGAIGQQGPKGDTGEQGPKGDKGDTGATGPKGDTGPQGAKGDKGDKGDTGDTGPRGATGATGSQGPAGVCSTSSTNGNFQVYGNLLLKNGSAYGCKLNFGDSDYVHLYEVSDDRLEIKATEIYLYGSSSKAMTVSGSTVTFHGTTSGVSVANNVVGTLPISHGGTGATSASSALSNLGAASSSHTHSASSISPGTFPSGNFQIYGNLLLKNGSAYGCKLNLGDGDYVHLYEPSDDVMELKGTTIKFYSSSTLCMRMNSGKTYANGSFSTTGADYAEMFEWADANPDKEDRVGLFVTLDGTKIKPARPGDKVLGVVSGNPSVCGDVYDDYWKGKYLKDVFGRPVTQEVVKPAYTDGDGVAHPAHVYEEWVLNPMFDPEQPYIPRSKRPEWDAVGLIGKLVVTDDGTCECGGYCAVKDKGVATASDTGYYVMARLDETHVQIFLK